MPIINHIDTATLLMGIIIIVVVVVALANFLVSRKLWLDVKDENQNVKRAFTVKEKGRIKIIINMYIVLMICSIAMLALLLLSAFNYI